MHLPTAEIPLKEIDWRDFTFRITWGRPLEPLRRSIREIGIQQAPVLQLLPSGRLRIVAGRRRLLILEEMKVGSIAARLATPEEPSAELYLFNFYDNLGSRTFNAVEQALALRGLRQYFAEEEVIRDYLPLVGLPPARPVLKRHLALAEVSPHFWPAFIQGRLFPETLELIYRDFQPWAELLLTLCLFLHFGFQKQKELLEGLRELTRRHSVPLETLLRQTGICDLLRRGDLSPQHKGEAWRRSLRTKRYPSLTATERAFSEQVRDLGLDDRTRLKPPPFFEGGRYELALQFTGRSDLEASLKRVQKTLEEGKFDDLP